MSVEPSEAMRVVTKAIALAEPVEGFPVKPEEFAAFRYGKDCALAAAREALFALPPSQSPSEQGEVARLREALAAEDEYWAASRALAAAFNRIRPQAQAAFNAASGRRDAARAALRYSSNSEQGEVAHDALVEIQQWADAYPLKVFPEPDLDKVAEVLEAAGLRGQIDRMHGSWARHLVTGIGAIATAALRYSPPTNDGEKA